MSELSHTTTTKQGLINYYVVNKMGKWNKDIVAKILFIIKKNNAYHLGSIAFEYNEWDTLVSHEKKIVAKFTKLKDARAKVNSLKILENL